MVTLEEPSGRLSAKMMLMINCHRQKMQSADCRCAKMASIDHNFLLKLVFQDASKEDQIEGLVKSVKWQMSSDRKVGALKLLQGLIWKQGYDKGDIKGQ